MKKGNSNGNGLDINATLVAGSYVIVLNDVKNEKPTATSANEMPMATILFADYEKWKTACGNDAKKKEAYAGFGKTKVGARNLLLPLGLSSAEDQKNAIKARTEFAVELSTEDASYEQDGETFTYQRKTWTPIK